MKGFVRKNQLLSLCGLNCGLCPMFIGKYCGGCGNGNQSCGIARCSLEQGKIEYCYECEKYPCDRYLHIDEYDSFITHRRQKLELPELREALSQIKEEADLDELSDKEKSRHAADVLKRIAAEQKIELRLRKKGCQS